jgi:ADP-heptose:LPS heptosyltransferase
VSGPVLLAYRPLGLGDLLSAVPALRALRDGFPGHRVVLAAPARLAPLATATGAVDEVLETAPLAVPSLTGADVSVNLHGRGPQSHRALLAARPRRLIAFACRDVPADGAAWRAREHEVRRWCRMLAESGIPADPARLDLPAPPACSLAGSPGATVLHPGAASPARRWPADRWAAVARAERCAGRRVVITGSTDEARLAAGIASAAGLPRDAVLAGRTGVAELAAVVAHAGRVVCGDTGVAHLATAYGVASVVLFGPTPPSEWGPPADRSRHIALHAGGRGDPHAGAPDPRLLAISIADVLSALASLERAARSR